MRAKFRAYPSGDSLGIVEAEKKELELKCGAFQITGRRMDYGLYFRRNDTVDFVGDGTV